MDFDLYQMNILANNITTIGDAVLTQAAVLEMELEETNDDNKTNDSGTQSNSSELNVLGNLIALIGDFFGAVLADAEVKKNIEEGEEFSEADRLDIIGSWLNVIGDYFSYLAAVKESQEK